MYSLLVRIMATLLAALFSLFNISADIPGFSDNKTINAQVSFANDKAGSADAVITLETTADGEYKLFWADEDFEKLTVTLGDTEFSYSEFASITTYFGEGSLDLPDYTAIPDNAKNILIDILGL